MKLVSGSSRITKPILQFIADYIISTLEMLMVVDSDTNQKEFDMLIEFGLMLDFYSTYLFGVELD